MGLDTYAQLSIDEELSEEDERAFQEAGISLCGGILSGRGNDGKVGEEINVGLLEGITGESLYEEWIPPEVVAEMYQKLESCNLSDYPERVDEVMNLRRFFKVCVDRNLGLYGWW